MEDMKGDMAGGAGTLHGIGAIAALGLPVRAIAVIAAAENLPGGDAFRPGDILRAANGKTIEIANTDAEGRLVLADALWYARREGATHVLDLATLTGAMELALGDLYAGLFANDDEWRDRIVAAGERSGDLAWPFPLHARYRRYVDSTYADMKNARRCARARPVLAAKFLEEFAGEGPWAHIDMAGPGFLERSRGDYYRVAGGTGYGVRLIAELASSSRMNYELTDEQELLRRTVRDFAESRVAPVAEELDREERFPYELVDGARRARADGHPDPRGVRRRRRRHRLVRDRDRGADAHRLVRRDHRRRAHVARHDADLPVRRPRRRSSEWLPQLASGEKLAAFGLTEPDAGSDAGATRTRAELRDGEWIVNGSKMFITNAGTDITACVTITARHRRRRDLEHHRPERDAGLRDLGADEEARLARVRHARALVQGLRRARGQPARPARQGLPPVHGDPRRRPHLGRGDGRRARAGRLRPRVRLREGARAVRPADREVPGGPVRARRHGDRDRGRTPARLPRRLAEGSGQGLRRSRRRRRSSTRACSRTAP